MSIFQSVIGDSFTIGTYLIALFAALVCGIILSLTFGLKDKSSKSFLTALFVLPMVVTTVILLVNGSIGTGIAVAGAFSLIRFRSQPGTAKEIATIFIAMASGLACGTGYIAIAILFTLILSLLTLLATSMFGGKNHMMDLRITVPEQLEIDNAFDDLFEKYTKSSNLLKVKTTNMGSLYKLFYQIELKDQNKIKEFIDELRVRNGNLEIAISRSSEKEIEL